MTIKLFYDVQERKFYRIRKLFVKSYEVYLYWGGKKWLKTKLPMGLKMLGTNPIHQWKQGDHLWSSIPLPWAMELTLSLRVLAQWKLIILIIILSIRIEDMKEVPKSHTSLKHSFTKILGISKTLQRGYHRKSRCQDNPFCSYVLNLLAMPTKHVMSCTTVQQVAIKRIFTKNGTNVVNVRLSFNTSPRPGDQVVKRSSADDQRSL